jgi:ABC-2 type transport system permease protein
MKNIIAIVQREFRAYFTSPIAYVVLAIFIFLSGLFFQAILAGMLESSMMRSIQAAQSGQPPTPIDMPGVITQGFLSTLSVILLFILPMITMALFSEEKKRGTIELLLTAPITDTQVVIGKFLAAAAFYALLLGSTAVEVALLYAYSDPVSGPIFTAYLGVLLYGLAVIAVGMFISTLTENQIVAAVLTFGVIMVLWLVDLMARQAQGTAKSVLTYLSILSHLDDFLKGVLDTSHIIFYLSLMLVAMFLTYRSLDSLRWRG